MTTHTATTLLTLIKEKDILCVDFRFTDPKGGWHHMTYHTASVDEEALNEGVMFDGSSIGGWRHIENSDMLLKPDFNTAHMDPFSAQPTLILTCDVYDPTTGEPYNRDPRGLAKRAEAHLKKSGLATTAYFGPEPEFFIFDDVRFDVGMQHSFYHINTPEGPYNTGLEDPLGNLGHRPPVKGGYIPVSPVDQGSDIRAEMLVYLERMGIVPEKHHHEVAPGQHELGFKYNTLLNIADQMQIFKYVVKNVAKSYGMSACFMPKPVDGDNGSGMHVHQSLWNDKTPLFMGESYAGLSETALWYIGGILKHGRALNAFANPTTNSYRRLIPGFEAPVMLTYAARNRSACIRIPCVTNPKARRLETRFPDPAANPYLCFAALLMAGLDGIKNKTHPGEAHEGNLYDPEVSKGIPTVATSLREALEALDKDRAFLTAGGVFDDDFIDAYIELKMEESQLTSRAPHPIEYKMYYGV